MNAHEMDENGCWLWSGALDRQGYGATSQGSERRAHRAYYRNARGPIPPGFHVHHKCHVKRCVNPDHLEALLPVDHLRGHWFEWSEITDEDRGQIRELARDPQVSARQIAETFGIPRPTVNKIIHGYSWFDGEAVEVERPLCLNCGEPITGGRRHKKFCDKTCRWTHGNQRRKTANA